MIKVFVGHDIPTVAFNLKECAKVAYERDGAVCVCVPFKIVKKWKQDTFKAPLR